MIRDNHNVNVEKSRLYHTIKNGFLFLQSFTSFMQKPNFSPPK